MRKNFLLVAAVALSMSVSCHHSPVPAEEQPGGQEPRYIDFYTPLSDSDGRFKDGYHSDGVHPDSNGYDVMEQILLAALK